MNWILAPVARLGATVLAALRGAGSLALFGLAGVSHLCRPPFYWRAFLGAFVDFAYFSLPVVALTAIFSGMVIALQSYTGFSRFNAQSAIAGIVVLSVVRELGPVLAGLMVAGRVGAAMAAEIGTMRVTDQIDALGTLSTNPMKYLVAPRLLAGTLALPLLVAIADILGVMGGFIVSVLKLGFSPSAYILNTYAIMQPMDVLVGLAKAAVFGFLIALMGCYNGYNSRGGAQGVGAATTASVVTASILVLAFDYILTEMFFSPMSDASADLPRTVPKIRVRGLRKAFGAKIVLDGIDLDVMPGTSFVVIGGSGSGKSVLLRCILGLIRPDAGSIEIDGVDVLRIGHRGREAVNARIGMLFQNGALFDSLPVWENVAFALLARGRLGRRAARAKASEVLAQVGLDPSVGMLAPAELSGGMQKRVGLARAIAARPEILFFDEPTTGLDPIMGAVIDGLIVDCVKRLGSTAVAITHDMASATRIGDRAAMLYRGKLVWQGPAASLLESGNPMVEQFTHGRREGPIGMELRR